MKLRLAKKIGSRGRFITRGFINGMSVGDWIVDGRVYDLGQYCRARGRLDRERRRNHTLAKEVE